MPPNLLKFLILRQMLRNNVFDGIRRQVSFNVALSFGALYLWQLHAAKKRAPVLVALLRVAWLAAGEKIPESVAMAAERLVLHCGMHVVPRFSFISAVDADEVNVWVLAKGNDSRSDCRCIEGCRWEL
ncbi:MAG: hypothetical protein DMF95_33185 [Acidobacteria bacterium]|nr:MAG: hypothetical protein DMF95_33185 [Acidobacteriota bacterium]